MLGSVRRSFACNRMSERQTFEITPRNVDRGCIGDVASGLDRTGGFRRSCKVQLIEKVIPNCTVFVEGIASQRTIYLRDLTCRARCALDDPETLWSCLAASFRVAEQLGYE